MNKQERDRLRKLVNLRGVDGAAFCEFQSHEVEKLLDHIDALENAVVEKDKIINREIERGNRLNKELYEALGGPTHVGILEAKAALTQAEGRENRE